MHVEEQVVYWSLLVLHRDGHSVLVHGSEGSDCTLLISTLAQLIMDPSCRTLEGFLALLEREWVQVSACGQDCTIVTIWFPDNYEMKSKHISCTSEQGNSSTTFQPNQECIFVFRYYIRTLLSTVLRFLLLVGSFNKAHSWMEAWKHPRCAQSIREMYFEFCKHTAAGRILLHSLPLTGNGHRTETIFTRVQRAVMDLTKHIPLFTFCPGWLLAVCCKLNQT